MARAAIRRDIDEEVDQERRGYSLDEAIESIAFGWFQIALLLLCGATQLADATELMVLSLLNNPVQCAFDVSKEEAAWLASAVFAGMLCGAYLTGLVADQFGRRAGFGMTTSLVAGFGLASAAAPSFELLVLARFFVGMGVGGANAALSLFVEYLPTRMRGLGLIFFFVFFRYKCLIMRRVRVMLSVRLLAGHSLSPDRFHACL
jgi:putative MFS transporter